MRLGTLLARLGEDELRAICRRVVPGSDEIEGRHLAHSIESVLRGSGCVEQTILARHPPVLALLRELLEAPEFSVCRVDLEIHAMEVCDQWVAHVSSGDLVGRDDSCRIYRRLLMAAWRNDLVLDASETALLGLLRHELGMTSPEHFLIAHHPDIQPFWRTGDPFTRVLEDLKANGILFEVDDDVVLPEEFADRVRKTIGIHMSREAATRLLSELSNEELRQALDRFSLKTSGSKADRRDRLIENLVPLPDVLDVANIQSLREIARKQSVQISGAKDELIARLVQHFESGADLVDCHDGVKEELIVEPKRLAKAEFFALFAGLTNHELRIVCSKNSLKHSGSKEIKINTLWESHLGEWTLLRTLKNEALKTLCKNHELEQRGPKDEKIDRLLEKFARQQPESDSPDSNEDEARSDIGAPALVQTTE